ncbi:hypothetical protein [Paenochrobactrum pullorum]|uniref:hypothetical protein n=1 Tax=Paenochrobactrum pullorum TaxID=1324351 RepID=UPI0035BBB391
MSESISLTAMKEQIDNLQKEVNELRSIVRQLASQEFIKKNELNTRLSAELNKPRSGRGR